MPGGPQAETWLTSDVYGAVQQRLRSLTTPWSILGWSTGGFCAAKHLLAHPQQYQSAASLGGYYNPLTDKTTGNLFHSRTTVVDQNSPTWLYQHRGRPAPAPPSRRHRTSGHRVPCCSSSP